jgi:hypothetical protein
LKNTTISNKKKKKNSSLGGCMNYNYEYLLSLVNSAVHGRRAEYPKEISVDWETIHKEAAAHNLSAVIYPTIESVMGPEKPHKELVNLWEVEAIGLGAIQLNKHLILSHLLAQAKERNIKMVLVKGILLGQLYPDYLLRISGDFDIFIYPKDRKAMGELLEGYGFELDPEQSIDCEETFNYKNILTIELHTRLWEETEGKKLELLESMDLTAEDKLICTSACDMEVWTLGYTQHLIYLIYHIVKHFIVSGIGIRHLTDLTLFINEYYAKIDFDDFWKNMKLLGYDKFSIKLFRLCIQYFEMNYEVLGKEAFEKNNIDEAMLEDIIEAGVFGGRTSERWKSGRIMRTYYENDTKPVPTSRLKIMIGFLLPNAQELSNQRIDKITYSKILPIAWMQRGVFLLNRWKKDKNRCSLWSRIQCSKKRILLLKELNLLK